VQKVTGRRNITVGGNFRVYKNRTATNRPQVSDVLRLQGLQLICLIVLMVLLAILTVTQNYLLDEIADLKSVTEQVRHASNNPNSMQSVVLLSN
jgi:uncharacterized membrane protein